MQEFTDISKVHFIFIGVINYLSNMLDKNMPKLSTILDTAVTYSHHLKKWGLLARGV